MGDYNSQMWLGRVGTLSFISLGALNLESNSNLFIYHNISTVIYSDLGLLPESLTSAFDFSFSSNSDPYVWGPASGIDWFETSAGVRRTTQAYLDISTLSFDVLNPDPPFAPNNQIPEPKTYAMMFAGLGLLGFMEWRKKSKGSPISLPLSIG